MTRPVLSFFLCASVALAGAACAAQAPVRYFMQPAGVQGSSTPYGANDAAGKYVQSGDARIYYEVYGKGEPVVVLHGGGVGTPYEMGGLIDRLRQRYRVIAVSTRGHGRSEIGSRPLSMAQKAADVAAVMQAVTDRPARIIGFSDGGFTAYQIAATRPELVDRIVVIGAGALEPGFFTADSLRVSDMEKFDRAFIEQQKRLMPQPERLQEFWSAYTDFWSKNEIGKPLLAQIRCPVLLLAGDEDDHAPVATMLQAHNWIANSRLCIVPKAWHTAFLDNFGVSWAAIGPFIDAKTASLKPSRKVPLNTSYALSR